VRASFSVVLPYFNEADYLPRTLSCWLAQTRPPDELILVDNGSTDGSAGLCRSVLGPHEGRLTCRYVSENGPGKTRALATGCALAAGAWIVFSDADTFYPPGYLEFLERLIAAASPRTVAVMALPVTGDADRFPSFLQRRAYVLLSKIFSKHAYTGGCGQCLRADALRSSGGYSESIWPYVLGDHEIMSRVLRLGRSLYHPDLWFRSSPRRRDRSEVRWTLPEMALYHATPFFLHRWLFTGFLGPRFARRGQGVSSLRRQPWKDGTGRASKEDAT
jgi:glycosyltransferase involved in cell wall biosynthesis